MFFITKNLNFIKNNTQIVKLYLRFMSASCKQQTKEFKPVVLGVPNKMRDNPVVKIIDTPEFKSIFTDELNTLVNIFRKYNYELRIAGGAVRDILMNIKPKDINLATTATPDQMKEMFTKENVRMINTRGEKRGTITPRINNETFEVTTLRIDVHTDGRKAEAKFTTDWELDASRRDLTINSMFLDFDGTLYDYFCGYEDLQQRRVVFVGDAAERIQEDYLRILRYFRFYGRIAQEANQHDLLTLKVIKRNANGLARISGERIWSEFRKILTGNFAELLVLEMINCGLAPYCGLPQRVNLDEFKKVSETLNNFDKPHYAILKMSSLLHNLRDAILLHSRLKLTEFEKEIVFFIVQKRDKVDVDYLTLKDYQKLCLKASITRREVVAELLKYKNKKDYYTLIKYWDIPKFPISGNLLRENVTPSQKRMDCIMNELKFIWVDSDFQITADELLQNHLPQIVRKNTSPILKPRKKINTKK